MITLDTPSSSSLIYRDLERNTKGDISKDIIDAIFLENTTITGLPACLVFSYLGNLQILQIILAQEKVDQAVQDLDKIASPRQKKTVLALLAIKLVEVSRKNVFSAMSTQDMHLVNRSAFELVALQENLLTVSFADTSINNEQLAEISKILYLSKARKITTFYLGRCANIDQGQLSKTLSLYKDAKVITFPLLYPEKFEKIKNFFRDTPFSKQFDQMELMFCRKDFSSVLCIICASKPHYFNLHSDLFAKNSHTLLTNDPLSRSEVELLNAIKKQCESTQQFVIDLLPSEKDKMLEAIKKQSSVLETFEVPASRSGYRRFAINIKP